MWPKRHWKASSLLLVLLGVQLATRTQSFLPGRGAARPVALSPLRLSSFEELGEDGKRRRIDHGSSPSKRAKKPLSKSAEKRKLNQQLEKDGKLPDWERQLRALNRRKAASQHRTRFDTAPGKRKVKTHRKFMSHFQKKWKEEASVLDMSSRRENSTALADVPLESLLQGEVLKLERFGAWLDVGAEVPGLLHIKDIRDDVFVEYVADELQVGQVLPVYAKYCDPENKKLGLRGYEKKDKAAQELEEDYIPMDQRIPVVDIPVGLEVSGKIRKVSNFGAYVDFGSVVEGFLHIKEVPDREVGQKPRDLFTTGQVLSPLYVDDVDEQRQRIKLTMEKKEYMFSLEDLEYGEEPNREGELDLGAADEAMIWSDEDALEDQDAEVIALDQGSLEMAFERGDEGESEGDEAGQEEDSRVWTFSVGASGMTGSADLPLPGLESEVSSEEAELHRFADEPEAEGDSDEDGRGYENEDEANDGGEGSAGREQKLRRQSRSGKEISKDVSVEGIRRGQEIVVHDYKDEYDA